MPKAQVNVTLSPVATRQLDAIAHALGITRSAVVELLLRERITEADRRQQAEGHNRATGQRGDGRKT